MSATEFIETIPVPPTPPGLMSRLGKLYHESPSRFTGDGVLGRYSAKFGAELKAEAARFQRTPESQPSGFSTKTKEILARLKSAVTGTAGLDLSSGVGKRIVDGYKADPAILAEGGTLGHLRENLLPKVQEEVAIQEGAAAFVAEATATPPAAAPVPAAPVVVQPVVSTVPKVATPRTSNLLTDEVLKAKLEAFEPGFNARLSHEWAACRNEAERDSLVDRTVARIFANGFKLHPSPVPALNFSNGTNGSQTINRAMFERLTPHQKSLHFRSGGHLID